MMIGFEGVMCGPSIGIEASSGELSSSVGIPTGGLGLDVLARLKAGVDLEAMFWNAAALSPSFMSVVRRDLRDTRLCFESTRWNKGACEVVSLVSDASSSQSSSSSSSSSSESIALSGISSSSSDDSKTSSSSWDLLRSCLDSTSSLNDSVFFVLCGRLRPAVEELWSVWDVILSSKELSSSSPEEPPSMNIPPFFGSSDLLDVIGLVGTGAGARCVCERNEEEIWFGENPRTTL